MNGGLRVSSTTICSKNADQMDKFDAYKNGIPKDLPFKTKTSPWVSDVDEKAAEDSLSLYCKPVELYNIIQQRSEQHPLFLRRCLSYKISAAMQRRYRSKDLVKPVVFDLLVNAQPPKIRMTISVTNYAMGKARGRDAVPSNGTGMRSVFVTVTRPVTYPTEGQVVFELRQLQVLKVGGSDHLPSAGVSFNLPEIRRLLEDAKSGDVVLFVIADSVDVGSGSQVAQFDKCTGCVVWGKLAFSTLCMNWLRSAKDNVQRKPLDWNGGESTSNIDLEQGSLEIEDSKDGKNIKISTMAKTVTERSLAQLSVLISGVVVGQTTIKGKSTNGSAPKSYLAYSLSHWRARIGRVIFHYLYYHSMLRKTEVTEDFSCPFCLNGCASFKGLQGHLNAAHDLFNFEYLVSGELQVVNVTCRADVVGPQGNIQDADGFSDPRVKNFAYWFPRSRLRRRKVPISSSQHLQDVKLPATLRLQGASDFAEEANLQQESDSQQAGDLKQQSVDTSLAIVELADAARDAQHVGDTLARKLSSKAPNGVSIKGSEHGDHISAKREHRKSQDPDSLAMVVKQRSAHGQKRQRMKGVLGDRSHARSRPSPTFGGACASAGVQDLDDCGSQQVLTIANKAIVTDISRSHALLQKRQYFHSHTAQPMDAEQLFEDKDSEDELDAVTADLEDRRMLNDFLDVTPEEKEVMHLWNSFVRRNRVVADGHCSWACGEFSRENAQRVGENPALRRCLMLFLVKLWNHHLVDGPTISQCLAIVDSYAP